MSDWLISVPVWGERCLRIFEQATWPALREALRPLQNRFTMIVHTDSPKIISAIVGEIGAIKKDVPPPDKSFMSLSNAHREVLHMAKVGQKICLLTADLVISPNSLETCDRILGMSAKLVGCMGVRVCEEEIPPLFQTGSELLEWGWQRRHPMTEACTWPNGNSYDIWRMYFRSGESVCCRLILPHPIALIKDRSQLAFAPTIDVNLMTNFRVQDIHIVTNPDELAMIELSPRDKDFLVTVAMQKRYNTRGPSTPSFVKLTHRHHRFTVSHKIKIKGQQVDCGDEMVVKRFMNGV